MVDGFARWFDRTVGLPIDDPDLCADLLDTTMLRPLGFAMAALGFVMMSTAAACTIAAPWATGWLVLDLSLLVARMVPALPAWRARRPVTQRVARTILLVACAMFVTFGAGCAASFLVGDEALRIAASIAMMGLLGGIATRWAALPRLAVATIVVTAGPMVAVVATVSILSATLFLVLAVGTAVLTVQNNRTLRGMFDAERTARWLSETDPLTGLLNRHGLERRLSRPDVDRVSLLFLDLDGFKAINDTFGHAAGDHVLATVGRRLCAVAEARVVARLGGDEFVLVLCDSARDPVGVAARLHGIVGAPIELPRRGGSGGGTVEVGASCGIATGSALSSGLAALLAEADDALYAVKRARSRAPVAQPTTRRLDAAA